MEIAFCAAYHIPEEKVRGENQEYALQKTRCRFDRNIDSDGGSNFVLLADDAADGNGQIRKQNIEKQNGKYKEKTFRQIQNFMHPDLGKNRMYNYFNFA